MTCMFIFSHLTNHRKKTTTYFSLYQNTFELKKTKYNWVNVKRIWTIGRTACSMLSQSGIDAISKDSPKWSPLLIMLPMPKTVNKHQYIQVKSYMYNIVSTADQEYAIPSTVVYFKTVKISSYAYIWTTLKQFTTIIYY